jgi:hypothetical protein
MSATGAAHGKNLAIDELMANFTVFLAAQIVLHGEFCVLRGLCVHALFPCVGAIS